MEPKIYLVGGAVRDKLLGRDSRDNDYVVVGASPEWMLEHGFEQVGSSFPVFLHPTTGEEYALARQERSTGPGYHDFEVKYDSTVTLEEDLIRRDLTINSMAMSEDGQLIDPYGGQHDLAQGILRHTSEAFAEDPLRVLRLARFAARYSFKVADETLALAQRLVMDGSLNFLPKERIWTELWKGMSERNPGIMVDVLNSVGAMYVQPVCEYLPYRGTWVTEDFELGISDEVTPEHKFLMIMGDISERIDLKKANDLRIPKSLYRTSQLYCALSDAWESELIRVDDVLNLIEETGFGGGSPELKTAIDVLTFEDDTSTFETRWKFNLAMMRRAVEAIKELDMATIAAVDRSNVKANIRAAKLEAVKKAMETR